MRDDDPFGDLPSVPPSLERLAVLGLAELAAAAEQEVIQAEAARQAGRQLGPSTGFVGLDDIVGGHLKPGVHVLLGGTGVGKTALALQIAATCGAPTLYVTAEMAPVELFWRITSRVNGVFLGRLRSGELDAGARTQFFTATAEACPRLWIADATEVPAAMDQIAEAVAAIRGQEAPLVVIDSLHEWADAVAPHGASEYESLGRALRMVRDFARRDGVAVLGLAEQNRASMSSGGLNSAAGSRKFEYKGHTVLDLQADENDKGDSWPKRVELRIHKNRSGSHGMVLPLEFDGRTQSYTEVRM